ncbi:histidinol-phosphatase HisJ [Metabacillus iocasae]|uniref:Histidinol-phosphatase n=1 Tax=Priestia iocasae TaxID=2291674 RepID=A0ABS2QQA1_9BACI|nr:histidinol-phosphatase HisJ [Metabacillus iocasae]MBM7701197.1 histidinol-phosphatase (PHP family) [Metabacillus iocasae]
MKADKHLHTPFCPHGSADTFEQYINQALSLGFNEISFTEHAPLPEGFIDPTPLKDSAMSRSHMEQYISQLEHLKKSYANDIKIHIGLEVDYIINFEKQTTILLEEYGPYLDDSILSVHFLTQGDQYYCLDYSDDEFARIIHLFSGVEHVYEAYYQTVLKSIQAELGKHKPNRIGHVTLVHKFQKRFPCKKNFKGTITTILDEIKRRQLQLDYNAAGLYKPFCQEAYPPSWIVKEAQKKKIPLVYGSDAHCSKDLGQGYTSLFPL